MESIEDNRKLLKDLKEKSVASIQSKKLDFEGDYQKLIFAIDTFDNINIKDSILTNPEDDIKGYQSSLISDIEKKMNNENLGTLLLHENINQFFPKNDENKRVFKKSNLLSDYYDNLQYYSKLYNSAKTPEEKDFLLKLINFFKSEITYNYLYGFDFFDKTYKEFYNTLLDTLKYEEGDYEKNKGLKQESVETTGNNDSSPSLQISKYSSISFWLKPLLIIFAIIFILFVIWLLWRFFNL